MISPLCFSIMEISVRLGGVPLLLSCAHNEYMLTYMPFACCDMPLARVGVSAAEVERLLPLYEEGSTAPYVEHMELCTRACDALLPFERAIFHGVAFIWRGQAWLLTALSGTGKTTHYIQWKRQYGGEISIINGDKPVLDFSEEGISVHPSPWRGKENMGSMRSAPLGGIIMLKQGQENAMRRVEPKEVVVELFMQFLFTRSTPLDVQRVCALEERLLQTVPVWQLVNRGDEASARLCHDTLAKEMYNA